MNISAFSKEELQKELANRLESKDDQNVIIAIGGVDGGRFFTECLIPIKTHNDLPNMDSVRLRARYNAHRQYKLFYFKSDDFDPLKKQFNDNNEEFSKWLQETHSVKSEYL
jgi:hypothetical protein